MWNPGDEQRSFPWLDPLTPPSTEPGALPTVCIQVNQSWIPYIVGVLRQLAEPQIWDTTLGPIPETAQERAEELCAIIATAPPCATAPVYFRLNPDGTLQYSLDQSDWTTLLLFAAPPITSAYDPPVPANAIANGAPFPYIWNQTNGSLVQNH